jgi:hypothetical protein
MPIVSLETHYGFLRSEWVLMLNLSGRAQNERTGPDRALLPMLARGAKTGLDQWTNGVAGWTNGPTMDQWTNGPMRLTEAQCLTIVSLVDQYTTENRYEPCTTKAYR